MTSYPLPNEHGVYSKDAAECISFAASKSRAECQLYVLQVGDAQWISTASKEFHCGDYWGSSGPLTAHHDGEIFPDRASALDDAVQIALRFFLKFLEHWDNKTIGSCAIPAQAEAAHEMLRHLRNFHTQTALFDSGADSVPNPSSPVAESVVSADTFALEPTNGDAMVGVQLDLF